MALTFDLLTARWLPCRLRDGTVREFGLRETLARSAELVELSATTPITQAALLRLLLAVLHAALDGPRRRAEVVAIWHAGQLPADVLDRYFERWADRFDLFSADRPFWQDPGLVLPAADTIARLAPELASGNNALLFDHTRDDQPPAVSAAVAARWLLTHQLFGLGGGKGPRSNKYQHPYASHAPAVTGVNVFLRGESLFQTLLLNLPVLQREDQSRPIWERDFPAPQERHATGWVEKLTWPNRAARLLPEEQDGQAVVRQVFTAQGAVLQDFGLRDPYFAMRPPRGKDDIGGPLRISSGRALWRDSTALLGFSPDSTRLGEAPRPRILEAGGKLLWDLHHPATAIPCCAIGMDFDKSKINLWRQDELTLPRAFLPSDDPAQEQRASELVGDLEAALEQAEACAAALLTMIQQLAEWYLPRGSKSADRRDDGKGKDDDRQIKQLIESWHGEARYWAALDASFADLLRQLPLDRDASLTRWAESCSQGARFAFNDCCRLIGTSARALGAIARARDAATLSVANADAQTGGDRD